MRELDCDFCGEPAAGAYEVLPTELDPTPDEQVRVVLCAGCRETLDGVLTPLLDRLGASDEGGVDPSFADATAGHAPPEAPPSEDGIDEGDDDPDLAVDAAGHAPPPTPSAPDGDPDAAPDGDDATSEEADATSEETNRTPAQRMPRETRRTRTPGRRPARSRRTSGR
ncbi:hypothetical protein [Halobaculum litoreum]|uniref:Uncharacterized protein n=1 Tax=Halobaculum litoreum TaxID=3031998 RepID=A0ABD5XS53_9EURY|nr:hypothetical protein [Halobaculum sp. DT92]